MELGLTPVDPDVADGPSAMGRAPKETPVLRAVADLRRLPTKLCPEGHPNDPAVDQCRLCERPVDAAAEVIEMAPSPLARLVFEDGTAIDVTGPLTIGRSPLDTPAVTGDEAGRPPVEGDTLTVAGTQVSRVHLMVEALGWRLTVQDCDSTNGTFTSRRGERGRRRVPIDEPVPLHVGDTLHFGARQALVIDARTS